MNNADALAETSSESEEISSRVLKMPEVVVQTFKYVDDLDLQQCGQVCSLWKDINEDILYNKIAILRKKIPITILNTLADNSETLRSFVKCGDNYQYLWFHLEPFNLCHSVKSYYPTLLTTPTEDDLFDARVFVHKNKDRENVQLPFDEHSATEDEIEINIAMFPSVPGFNIRHFSFTLDERRRIRKEKMPYVSKLLEIPKEKVKCVIGIIDYGIDFHDDKNGAYYGYSLNHLMERGIAFYGENVEAVYLCLKHDYYTIKEKLDRIKRLMPETMEEKCFAFVFCSYQCKKSINAIIEAFKPEFPFITFVVYHYLPSFLLCNPPENYNYYLEDYLSHRKLACIVLVWYK